ncbi:MAG: uL15m family ribosomal protein [Candidatus Micrarchaeia archaeon]
MTFKRKSKRNRKYFGTRSHGKGNAKNRRGSGSKGGWGRAGMHKHRFSYATTHEREWMMYGGRRGFSNPTTKVVQTINLYNIESMVDAGKLEKKGAMFSFSFDGKILGCGILSHAVEVSANSASEKAIERIKAAGGKFIQLRAEEADAEPKTKA